jgi:hypothetical protein
LRARDRPETLIYHPALADNLVSPRYVVRISQAGDLARSRDMSPEVKNFRANFFPVGGGSARARSGQLPALSRISDG